MSMIAHSTPMTSLPDDLHIHTFYYFDAKDLGSLICLVNKQFKKLSERDQLWKSLANKKFAEIPKLNLQPYISWKEIYQIYKETHSRKSKSYIQNYSSKDRIPMTRQSTSFDLYPSGSTYYYFDAERPWLF